MTWIAYIVINNEKLLSYDHYTCGSYTFSGVKPLPRIGEQVKFNIPHADITKKGHKGYLIEDYLVKVIDILHDDIKYQTHIICDIVIKHNRYSHDE